MAAERAFLGWDRPCLPQAAEWLWSRYAGGGGCDLGRVLVVTPTRRAGRRLLELLVDLAGDRPFIPATLVTPLELPERLYRGLPAAADSLHTLLAWAQALRSAPAEVLARVVPQPPQEDDVAGWMALARELAALHEALAAERVPLKDVPRRCGAVVEFCDERWQALHVLERSYERVLGRLGLSDIHALRREALRRGACGSSRDVVLVATAELPGLVQAMLEQVDARVVALVHAPEREAAGFNALGTIVPAHWAHRHVELDPDAVHVVDRPRDQAARVCRLLQAEAGGAAPADGVTVGVGDPAIAPTIERALTLAGIRTASEAGRPMARTRPALLLTALAAYLSTARFDAFAALLRHPDVEEYLALTPLPPGPPEQGGQAAAAAWAGEGAPGGEGGEDAERAPGIVAAPERHWSSETPPPGREDAATLSRGERGKTPSGREDAATLSRGERGKTPSGRREDAATLPRGERGWEHILTLLDRYISEHVQRKVRPWWLGHKARALRLKAVHAALVALLPTDAHQPRPLHAWCDAIAGLLGEIYGGRALDTARPDDAEVAQSLEAIAAALRQQAELAQHDCADGDALVPRVPLAAALSLTVDRLTGQAVVAEGAGDDAAAPAVELLDWAEVQLDDAPMLVLAGVNEGWVPRSVCADTFLPDRVRQALGLPDNAQRYARDLYALTAILHSRTEVHLVTGRRSADDDPLTPSRLLLACAEDQLPQRVLRFYRPDEKPGAQPLVQAEPAAAAHADAAGLTIPAPVPPVPAIDRLSVTAFRDYIACPYRFYLRHVVGLETLDDRALEMQQSTFGSLAHDVLRCLAEEGADQLTDARDLEKLLTSQLHRLARERFGEDMPAAILIQCHQLRDRLAAMARRQAEWARDGWRVVRGQGEHSCEACIDIDGQPFTLTGRIDRIERNERTGAYRILDYKTGDAGLSPDATHRTGPRDRKEWIDLQLPLYRVLARGEGIVGHVALGYVCLPKKLGEVGLIEAPWTEDELAQAEEKAKEIIRAVRAGIFWPPREPPAFEDGYEGICMDECPERARVIREVKACNV